MSRVRWSIVALRDGLLQLNRISSYPFIRQSLVHFSTGETVPSDQTGQPKNVLDPLSPEQNGSTP